MANALVPSNVPQNMKVGRVDSISDVPYRIGYSFRNPQIVKQVTRTRERPYFAMDWAIKGPAQVKEELFKSGKLQKFPSVWRRSAKAMNTSSLNVVGNRRELPNFEELGQAPGPTDKETVNSNVFRDVIGFLQNRIKDVGSAISESQKLEILRAQAQGPYATSMPIAYTPSSEGIGMLGWAAIVGAIGIGTFMYVRR
jgi:hypothetical protein